MEHFLRYWPFVRGIHRSLHKGQWRGALMFSLICGWINGWVNKCKAGDLRCHRAHYGVIVMSLWAGLPLHEAGRPWCEPDQWWICVVMAYWYRHIIRALGLYSLSGKTSYRKISWSLGAARLGVIIIVSPWNLTGISAALLPRCLSNFRAIGKVQTRISRLRDFTRSCGKTSYRLMNRGPDLYNSDAQ